MKLTQKYRERMRNSQHVQNKINELCALYGLNADGLAVLLQDDGTIEVSGLFISAIAKCHPDDTFDINKGLELAFKRLASALGVLPKWAPEYGERYFYVFANNGLVTNKIRHDWELDDDLAIAVGNCFKTQEEAEEHASEIIERYQKLIAYAKELNK